MELSKDMLAKPHNLKAEHDVFNCLIITSVADK